MLRLLLIPLIPIFVMLVKSVIEDAMEARRTKKLATPKKKAPEPKVYDHEWPDDD